MNAGMRLKRPDEHSKIKKYEKELLVPKREQNAVKDFKAKTKLPSLVTSSNESEKNDKGKKGKERCRKTEDDDGNWKKWKAVKDKEIRKQKRIESSKPEVERAREAEHARRGAGTKRMKKKVFINIMIKIY